MVKRVVYTAAHGGYAEERVPLGGGAAVCDALVAEWRRTRPFELELITPAILGERAPAGRDLVGYREGRYAEFCRDFERAATSAVARHDPAETAVLVNDVSEGPAFAELAARGFAIHTIYHVDVVAYVSAMYARGLLRPATLARLARWANPVLPDIARLVFDKQEASVRHSRRIIVPSGRMKAVLEDCYPWCRDKPDLVQVTPWGTWAQDPDEAAVAEEVVRIRTALSLEPDSRVLLTLSRISPEKGQDRLLNVLLRWEQSGASHPFNSPLHIVICGEAAFMQGASHMANLRQLAARFRRVRVHFPGFVTGIRKDAFLRLADLYVFPSRHESYGLTLLEALHAGLPAVCLDHHGADEVLKPEFGRVVRESELAATVLSLLEDRQSLEAMSLAARNYARSQPFATTAARLASIICEGR